jgi:hypothetical protein
VKIKKMETKESFYRLVFSGTPGAGVAVMVLDSGMVVDAVIYEGTMHFTRGSVYSHLSERPCKLIREFLAAQQRPSS